MIVLISTNIVFPDADFAGLKHIDELNKLVCPKFTLLCVLHRFVLDKYLIIIIFINCNWVVTRWQWLFYIYTGYEIGY